MAPWLYVSTSSTSSNQQHIVRYNKTRNLVLSNNCRLSLQWILAQCWIPGNEQTYMLANQGAKTEQPGAIVTYQEKAIITKALMMPSQENDAYHLLSRQERVILVRLRTRNNQWNAHMHTTLTMVPSAAVYLVRKIDRLQNCKRHDQERPAAWPTETTLHQKLLGNGQHISSL